ncbi:hypothetical protein PLEOSDRAFT_165547 [Pleurotus ostreatus PC15]|uniref:Uncharacterized protein n=1 Tax=Pleurotus ostreatus (strain PC15) TaxID=1137138 RepID=A0A067NWU7_PLEO1|nr:hypothetical protein PLEOSDRAFT_165547 [Pleurotus ostreatus PC15]
MSSQYNNTSPEDMELDAQQPALDPTPAQAAAIQSAKTSRKGKEGGSSRNVSNAVEEERNRRFTPYQKRDKEGEGDQEGQNGQATRNANNPGPSAASRNRASHAPAASAPATGAGHQGQPPPPVPLVQPAPPQGPAQAGAGQIGNGGQGGNGNLANDEMMVDQPENPHLQTTSAVPLTTLPPRPGKGPEILSNLLKSPLDFLLLLPYGAGRRLHNEFPNLGDDILEYIKEFRAPNCEKLTVVKAAADAFIKGRKPRMYKRDFEPPWVFILSGFSAELRDFLLGVGVFDFTAGETNHAFTVLKVQENVRSWHVAYLSGDGVSSDRQMMEEGLEAIRAKLKDNEKVRTSVQECYAGRTTPNLTTTDERVLDALSTLAITFTSNEKAKFWHLTAKPITDDPTMHRRWEEALKDTKNFVLRKIFAKTHALFRESKAGKVRSRTKYGRDGLKRTGKTAKERHNSQKEAREGEEAEAAEAREANEAEGAGEEGTQQKTTPSMPNKRKRDGGDDSTTAQPEEWERDERDRSGPQEVPELERITTRKDKGKEDETRPKKKKKEHIPCQPPTIRDGSSVGKLTIEWTVRARKVWEGRYRKDIVEVDSAFAEQVEGAPTTPNPHWTKEPPQPSSGDPKCTLPTTKGIFPNIVLSEAAIIGNVRREVAVELKVNHENYMALIPIGAGNRIFEQPREMIAATEALLRGLANDGVGYEVAAPVRENEPPHGARFAKPFAMILKDPSPELRTKLIEAKVVAFRREGKNHAFVASNITPPERPWVICNFKGNPVTNDTEKMAKALKAIGEQMLKATGLRTLANSILRDERIGRSAEERAHVGIAGLSLAFIERRDEEGQEDPIWQLHGRPLTKEDKKHREWLRAVRRMSFFLDATTELVQERKQIGCVWCKSETHTSLFCPLPRVKDWLGPTVPRDNLFPEPRDTAPPKEGKRGNKKDKKGKAKHK